MLFAAHETKEGSYGGEHALDAAWGETAPVTGCAERAHVLAIDIAPASHVLRKAITPEGLQIARIMFAGQRGKPALEAQVPDEIFDPFLLAVGHWVT
jgi:hypothetical protein